MEVAMHMRPHCVPYAVLLFRGSVARHRQSRAMPIATCFNRLQKLFRPRALSGLTGVIRPCERFRDFYCLIFFLMFTVQTAQPT